MTSCFVYKVIRDIESIDHLCINPIRDYIDSRQLKWSVQGNISLNNSKQNMTSLSPLASRTETNCVILGEICINHK